LRIEQNTEQVENLLGGPGTAGKSHAVTQAHERFDGAFRLLITWLTMGWALRGDDARSVIPIPPIGNACFE